MGKPEQFTVGCLFLFLFLFFHSNKHFRSGLSLTPSARRLTIFFFFLSSLTQLPDMTVFCMLIIQD